MKASRKRPPSKARVPDDVAGDGVESKSSAEEQIRMRAYELYRERGGIRGDDLSDWLRAEREYLERSASDHASSRPEHQEL